MARWFDEQDFVEFYMPFGVMRQMQGVTDTNRLMDANGAITALGSWVCLRDAVAIAIDADTAQYKDNA